VKSEPASISSWDIRIMQKEGAMKMRDLRRMASIALPVIMAVLSVGLSAVLAGESSTTEGQTPSSQVPGQGSGSASQKDREAPPARELDLRTTSIEDILLQKGAITKDEWIRIRAGQEYKAADQTRRLDSLEEWKNKTELLPILRDKVNFGLNALQFLYGHVNARVP